MEIAEAKRRLADLEEQMADSPMVSFATFETPHGNLEVYVTERLERRCRRGRVWKTPGMLATLKNAAYGFDPVSSRSRGGSDGIFVLVRHFRPKNRMMRALFDGFLDKPDSSIATLEAALGAPSAAWVPVRLVSHHMRLLGVVHHAADGDRLVLVDYDAEKP